MPVQRKDANIGLDSDDVRRIHRSNPELEAVEFGDRMAALNGIVTGLLDGGEVPQSLLPSPQELTDAASISWDASAGKSAHVTITADRALATPSNIADGDVLTLVVRATGGSWRLNPSGDYRSGLNVLGDVYVYSGQAIALQFIVINGIMWLVGEYANSHQDTVATSSITPLLGNDASTYYDIISGSGDLTVNAPSDPTARRSAGQGAETYTFVVENGSGGDRTLVWNAFWKQSNGSAMPTGMVVPDGESMAFQFALRGTEALWLNNMSAAVMVSPDGTAYQLTIDNAGNLDTNPI